MKIQLIMQPKSNQIKSKKQKLTLNKPEQKIKNNDTSQKQPIQSIVIQNDSPSNHSSSVQILQNIPQTFKEPKLFRPRHEFQTKEVHQQPRFNQFNIQKLKKVNPLLKPSSSVGTLNVEICDRVPTNCVDDMRMINYRKPGSQTPQKNCQNYLRSRLEKIEEQPTKKQKQEPQNNNNRGNSVNKLQNGLQETEVSNKIRKNFRYFDDEVNSEESNGQNQDEEPQKERSRKCFRCGGKGHIARLCDKEQVIRCTYCLGLHSTNTCLDKICRNCGQKGHIKQDCHNRVNTKIKCNKCGKYGHIMKNCGRIVMMNFTSLREKQIRQRYSKEDLEKLKCLKCNGIKDCKGHFNCHEYKKIPKIYEQSTHIQI